MCGYLNLEILLVKQVTLTWVKFVKSNEEIENLRIPRDKHYHDVKSFQREESFIRNSGKKNGKSYIYTVKCINEI